MGSWNAYTYHNLFYKRLSIKATMLAALIQYKTEREAEPNHYRFRGHGYSRDIKISTAAKLIDLISGEEISLNSEDRRVISNGQLGKITKQILNSYDPLLLFEMLCYERNKDSISNNPKYAAINH